MDVYKIINELGANISDAELVSCLNRLNMLFEFQCEQIQVRIKALRMDRACRNLFRTLLLDREDVEYPPVRDSAEIAEGLSAEKNRLWALNGQLEAIKHGLEQLGEKGANLTEGLVHTRVITDCGQGIVIRLHPEDVKVMLYDAGQPRSSCVSLGGRILNPHRVVLVEPVVTDEAAAV